MDDAQRLFCPKCKAEGRLKCTRFHMVQIGGKTYIRCERVKLCDWKREIK